MALERNRKVVVIAMIKELHAIIFDDEELADIFDNSDLAKIVMYYLVSIEIEKEEQYQQQQLTTNQFQSTNF